MNSVQSRNQLIGQSQLLFSPQEMGRRLRVPVFKSEPILGLPHRREVPRDDPDSVGGPQSRMINQTGVWIQEQLLRLERDGHVALADGEHLFLPILKE